MEVSCMKKLWNMVNNLKTGKMIKNKIYLALLVFVNIILGGLLWLLLGRLILPGIDWLLCFMGYPAMFIGFFGGILCLYNT